MKVKPTSSHKCVYICTHTHTNTVVFDWNIMYYYYIGLSGTVWNPANLFYSAMTMCCTETFIYIRMRMCSWHSTLNLERAHYVYICVWSRQWFCVYGNVNGIDFPPNSPSFEPCFSSKRYRVCSSNSRQGKIVQHYVYYILGIKCISVCFPLFIYQIVSYIKCTRTLHVHVRKILSCV